MEAVITDFIAGGNGLQAVAKRTATADKIIQYGFEQIFSEKSQGIAALAVGGYGRAQLFPHSDVDLLLLFESRKEAVRHARNVSDLVSALWDAKLRISQSVRDPANCTTLAANNTELHISLLDTRFIAGDKPFCDEFVTGRLPKFYLREQKAISSALAKLSLIRHKQYDHTIYHLEPDVKETPGGLRDYQLACWMTQLDNLSATKIPDSEEYISRTRNYEQIQEAKKFLFTVRCYLHYFYGRDKNNLNFNEQELMVMAGQGRIIPYGSAEEELMREYYKHSRSINLLAKRQIEKATSRGESLLMIFQRRKAKLSTPEFNVSGSKIFLIGKNLESDPKLVLKLIMFQARHGLLLASETERRIQNNLESIKAYFDSTATHWEDFREILLLPHTYMALQTMRDTGILFALFPDYELVDCLVIRDFYHRYTVDEHTFITIKILKELQEDFRSIDSRFSQVHQEVKRKELLYFALLFHDVGKGVKGKPHAKIGVELSEKAMDRIGLNDEKDRETIKFLIGEHLAMSKIMISRDLGDSSVLRDFKKTVRTLEDLNLLAVLTYADTVAVNPHAVITWRKGLLWNLYTGMFYEFRRELGDLRIADDSEAKCLELASSSAEKKELQEYLFGFPERYLGIQTPERVFTDFQKARNIGRDGAIVEIERVEEVYEITVMAWDQNNLYATLCAVMLVCNLNIESLEGFSNGKGLALDRFKISKATDAISTVLDQNELEDLKQRLEKIATGAMSLGELLAIRNPKPIRKRSGRPPYITYDNETSEKATILNLEADDRVGLMFDYARLLAGLGCSIYVILQHTFGQRSIVVLYVLKSEKKLPQEMCETIVKELEVLSVKGSDR